jgi:uncharacterized metal-binding protein YceD (DUF177 family)
MQFNVAQLLKEPTGSTRQYELAEALDELDPDLKVLGPLVGVLTLLRTNSGVLATGELSTAVRVTCSRCEEPIALVVRFNLEESFHPTTEVYTGRVLRPDEYEGELDELDDAALLIDDKHILDMSEVIRQSIWLALPMYPGCNWSGPGPCPNLTLSLQDLEDVRLLQPNEPSRKAEVIDPRWAALLELDKTGENPNEL